MSGLSSAFFIDEQVQERTVKLPDGSEHQLHFKQLPASEFRRFFMAMNTKDEEALTGATCRLIAASVCNPDGSRAMTEKDAARLSAMAERAISEAVLDVNGMGQKAGKD